MCAIINSRPQKKKNYSKMDASYAILKFCLFRKPCYFLLRFDSQGSSQTGIFSLEYAYLVARKCCNIMRVGTQPAELHRFESAKMFPLYRSGVLSHFSLASSLAKQYAPLNYVRNLFIMCVRLFHACTPPAQKVPRHNLQKLRFA